MSYTYYLHSLAVKDFSDGYAWYEDKQAGLGEKFIKAVRNKIDEITLNPEIYGSRSRKIYREAKVDFFPYLIVYKLRTRKKEIFISALHNTYKHPRRKYCK